MPNEIWEILGAIAGILSFIFAIFVYFKAKSERLNEKAKIEIYKERLASLHFQLTTALYSTDSIVQLAKQDSATVSMLQNLARINRGQLYSTIKQVEKEREYLKSWRYGQMIESLDQNSVDSQGEDSE